MPCWTSDLISNTHERYSYLILLERGNECKEPIRSVRSKQGRSLEESASLVRRAKDMGPTQCRACLRCPACASSVKTKTFRIASRL